MKRVRLNRNDRRRLQGDDTGQLAQTLAAEEYASFSEFRDSQQFDLATDSGTVVEVKSTLSVLANGNAGRFRLFKKQHEPLVRKDRSANAWYVFVLFDIDGPEPVAKMIRKAPADVGRVVGARGGWNRSGHNQGMQHKLPIDAVF